MPQDNAYVSKTPTLIIGLGGLGSSIAQSVHASLDAEAREYVEVHVMDTDVQELADARYQTLMNNRGLTQTSSNGTLGECVDRLEDANKEARKAGVLQWFPNATYTMNRYKLLNKGAAQVRAISRLALVDTFHSGRIGALQSALNRLMRARPGLLEPAARVIVVNSLAGGTGSGAFIQVALYVRAYLDSQGAGSNLTVRAFVAMPEIFIRNGDYAAQDLQWNVKANGYAALKELDGCIRTRGRYFEESSRADMAPLYPLRLEYKPHDKQPLDIGEGGLPFDVVTLFEYAGDDGANLGSKSAYIAQMEDTIKLHLFSPLEGRGGIESQTDNLANTHMQKGDRSRYAGCGSASVEYPVEDMVEYAALRWATDGISQSWLELDRMISDEMRRVDEERRNGNFLKLPDAHDRFGELLRDQAQRKHPSPFYKLVFDDAHELDGHGKRDTSKNQAWLEAVKKRLQETVKGALDENSPLLPKFDESQLKDPVNTVSTVRDYEEGLIRFRQAVVQRIQPMGRSLAKSILWNPYDDGVPFHKADATQLNTWLLAKPRPLHPMAIRYVLVEARLELRKLLGNARDKLTKTTRTLDAYAKSWDEPSTKNIETAPEMAQIAADKHIPVLRNTTDGFAKDYASRSAAQLNAIKDWAYQSAEMDCYEVLVGTLEDLADLWRSWFLELESLVDTFHRQVDKLGRQHEQPSDRTRRYVLASSAMKSEKWAELMPELASELMPPEVSQEMYLAAYRAKGSQYRDGLPPSVGGHNMKAVFETTVLAWCRKRLRSHMKLDLNVGEAIVQEVKLQQKLSQRANEQTSLYALKDYLGQLESLAKPWVQAGNHGQPFDFVCGHPAVKALWGKKELEEVLPNAFWHEGFSKYRLTRLSLRYALCAHQLLTMKNPDALYRSAYEARIAASRRLPPESSTPHLDFRWDSPAFLPELDDEDQARAMQDLHFAALLNWALTLTGGQSPVFAHTYDLALLWHWSPSPGQYVPASGPDGHSVPATLFGLVDVLAMNHGWVKPLLVRERRRQLEQRTNPEQAPLVQQLNAVLVELSRLPSQAAEQAAGSKRQGRLLRALVNEVLSICKLAEGTPAATVQRARNLLQPALVHLGQSGCDAGFLQLVQRTVHDLVQVPETQPIW